MAKNEKTSKRVASKSSNLLRGDIDAAIDACLYAAGILRECKSAIASALTQAPDRKKK